MGRRSWSLLCALVALTAVVAGCADAGHTTGAAPPVTRSFMGMVAPEAFNHARTDEFRQIAATGVGTVRQVVSWPALEPTPGSYEFAAFDAGVAAAARAHVRILPTLYGTPNWVVARAGFGTNVASYPPRDPAAMGRFAAALVRRYGPGGAFWRTHPGLPREPIEAWQIWNEPNLPEYWGGRPDPAGYARLLRAVSTAIHRASPRALVISAGIPNSRLGIPFTRWVEQFLAHGGKGTFDVFGLHAYAATPAGTSAAVTQARALLRSHGLARTPIWITEFGWADRGPQSAFTVGPHTQAFYVRGAVTQLAHASRRLGLRGIVYFQWRDRGIVPGGPRGWGIHTGLETRRGLPKPAQPAFAGAARAAEAPR